MSLFVLDPGTESLLVAQYTFKGYAVIARLLDPNAATEWESAYRSLPGRRVRVGTASGVRWLEQAVADVSHALNGLAVDDAFVGVVKTVAGLRSIDHSRTKVWINRYSAGEYVPEHRDSEGSTQLVLCLQAPPRAGQAGQLLIGGEAVPLSTGDAVLFHARRLLHATTPFSSGGCRVTCVIRFYEACEEEQVNQ